ncbi:MAG: hypothetical protein NT027_00375, partial [Proteobacteria bacterium]|nr:hypothetical protein [Pseudomonadota bacterium]
EIESSEERIAATELRQSNNEAFLGIKFSKAFLDIYKELESPINCLDSSNLGLFLVVAEEVSHFREIHFKLEQNRFISKFDLELQSEFDKIIAAMLLLKIQTGAYHALPLARLAIDSSTTYSNDDIYDRAGVLAAKWWWRKLNIFKDQLLDDPRSKRQLQEIASHQGQSKKDLIFNQIDEKIKLSA